MRRVCAVSLALLLGLTGAAQAQDASLGGAAVGADAGAFLGATFSNLPFYHDGHGAMMGGLAGSVLGTLALVPIGNAPEPGLATARSAQPPVAIRIECRNITDTMDVDGAKVEVKGLVCKQPDGTWKVSP